MSSPSPRILIVEDAASFRDLLEMLVREAGYEVVSRESGQEALIDIKAGAFDVVLLDHRLPGMNGADFLGEARRHQPELQAIFITGTLTLEDAIRISQRRVTAIFPKPPEPAALLKAIAEAITGLQKARADRVRGDAAEAAVAEVAAVVPTPPAVRRPDDAVGEEANEAVFLPRHFPAVSDTFEAVARQLLKFRDFRSAILLRGEKGAMFEEIARDLVENSAFRGGVFLIARPADFSPSGLAGLLPPIFGTTEMATVVLTQVETFDREQQVLLERFLTGSGPFIPFAGRYRALVCATRQLELRVEAGDFDEDLYFRFSTLAVTLPPLAEFRSDFARLVRRILKTAEHASTGPQEVTASAIAYLEDRAWPGDYDEFRQFVLAASRFETGSALTVAAFEAAGRGEVAPPPPPLLPPADPAAAPSAMEAALPPASSEESPAPAPEANPPIVPPAPARPARRAYDFGSRLQVTLAHDAAAPVTTARQPQVLRRHE